eukprot:COSAG06_NODE_815_length_12103_cov_4.891458_5_plen_80_part_00
MHLFVLTFFASAYVRALACYRLAPQEGDPGYNITKTASAAIVDPWVKGFTSDDPAEGGCPRVQPLPCKGPQCPVDDYTA